MNTHQARVKSKPVRTSTPLQKEAAEVEYRVSKTAIGIIAVLSAFIGIWGLVCLASGFLMCSDLIELGSNWFSAIMGL